MSLFLKTTTLLSISRFSRIVVRMNYEDDLIVINAIYYDATKVFNEQHHNPNIDFIKGINSLLAIY